MICTLHISGSILFLLLLFFLFNDTAPTEIYTLSLHDALPIWHRCADRPVAAGAAVAVGAGRVVAEHEGLPALEHHRLVLGDRKSTRLNSSHVSISYAVFCLKKKKKKYNTHFIYNKHTLQFYRS